jgi:hypothetical protein
VHPGVFAEELRYESAGGVGGEEAGDCVLGAEDESGRGEEDHDEEAKVGDLIDRCWGFSSLILVARSCRCSPQQAKVGCNRSMPSRELNVSYQK